MKKILLLLLLLVSTIGYSQWLPNTLNIVQNLDVNGGIRMNYIMGHSGIAGDSVIGSSGNIFGRNASFQYLQCTGQVNCWDLTLNGLTGSDTRFLTVDALGRVNDSVISVGSGFIPLTGTTYSSPLKGSIQIATDSVINIYQNIADTTYSLGFIPTFNYMGFVRDNGINLNAIGLLSDTVVILTNDSIRLSVDTAGTVTINSKLVIPTFTPSSSSDTGIKGQIAWDDSFIYICTETNTWKRLSAPLNTW